MLDGQKGCPAKFDHENNESNEDKKAYDNVDADYSKRKRTDKREQEHMEGIVRDTGCEYWLWLLNASVH